MRRHLALALILAAAAPAAAQPDDTTYRLDGTPLAGAAAVAVPASADAEVTPVFHRRWGGHYHGGFHRPYYGGFGYSSFYRPYYGGWGGSYYGGFAYHRPFYNYGYYNSFSYYQPYYSYGGWGGHYYGISDSSDVVTQSQTLEMVRAPQRPAAPARLAAAPARRAPAGFPPERRAPSPGTYSYDGGPADPVPLPAPDRAAPAPRQPAAVADDGTLLVNNRPKANYQYLAYGEKPAPVARPAPAGIRAGVYTASYRLPAGR